jgi:hypothetical protein
VCLIVCEVKQYRLSPIWSGAPQKRIRKVESYKCVFLARISGVLLIFPADIYTASSVTVFICIRNFQTANATTMGLVRINVNATKDTVYTTVVTL